MMNAFAVSNAAILFRWALGKKLLRMKKLGIGLYGTNGHQIEMLLAAQPPAQPAQTIKHATPRKI